MFLIMYNSFVKFERVLKDRVQLLHDEISSELFTSKPAS